MLIRHLIITLQFFLLGSLLLTIFTVWVYRSGVVHRSRHTDGTLNTQSDWFGKFLSILFLLLSIALILGYDLVIRNSFSLPLWQVVLANFVLLFSLTLFDSFVIDLWVLARWKPTFLKVPEDVTIDSMRFHVKKTFQLGWIILLIISLSSALIEQFFR